MLMKKVITQFLCGLVVLWLFPSRAFTQDWIKTGTGLGVERIRIAVPDFKASSQDPRNAELLRTFNDTLWNDLNNAGIFEMVSKSFYPLGQVGAPADVKFETWPIEHQAEHRQEGQLVAPAAVRRASVHIATI